MRLLVVLSALTLLAAAPPPRANPVPLSVQPGTPLDAAARRLLADDLADARRNRDRPLVFTGSAPLGPVSDRPALFVQLQSARECGSAGCSTSVYLWQKNAWNLVLDGVAGKLALGPGKSHGMADLVTETERYVWNGQEYHSIRPAPQIDLRQKPRKH